ncbi:MAG TPA: TlyA family RNA methyltransferase [Methylibium sp.]|uniref:TlyA family RNA methyltransferase n=1 Tax=Methylibium sp. TaxID=2067992 RepID=UPI002DBECBCE|nr:TlyA family RNA methyltransferase [Methylibium sp.]HEU4457886.1 TlyA family RNA methyltransferase [Methylibium sp.]
MLLVQRGLAPTRSAAQRLIERGAVERGTPAGWSRLRKTGEDVGGAAELRVTDDAELRWASRAGLKLDAAIADAGLEVRGTTCLDAGQSTGGFTDVLLARGAARVVGFDVGHGQLHARLRDDARVVGLEGLHVRSLRGSSLEREAPSGGFDRIVGDLSFIAMSASIAPLARWLATGGAMLLLIKPQFEVGPQHVGKGGVVKDATQYGRVESIVRQACASAGLQVLGYFESAVGGGDGNREFFVHAVHGTQERP